ncbi:MAG: hypothetical protein L0Y71_12770 [Gemmataceae bacterium]|nr:hypothetical protein [Gemmataceae bacterium]
MPITVSCPSCGGTIKAPENLAGRKVKCPKCTAVMMLPAAAGGIEAIQATPPAPAAPPAMPSASPAPPPPRQSSRRADREDRDDWDDDRPSRADRDGGRYDDDRDDDRDDDVARVRASRGGTNGLAIAGMVLGIVGFLTVFIPCVGWVLAIILGIVGATLSGIGLGTASKYGSGKGMAIAGLVLSILAIIWVPIWIFIIVGSTVNAVNQAIQQAKNQRPFVIQDKAFVPNFPQPGAQPQGPPTPAIGKVELANGQATVQGNLGPNDPKDRSRLLSACKVYTIAMVAGKTYQIDMLRTPGGLDPYLRLEDAEGKNLTENDDGGDNLNARIQFMCTQAGEYRIVATTFGGGRFGNFTLQVNER